MQVLVKSFTAETTPTGIKLTCWPVDSLSSEPEYTVAEAAERMRLSQKTVRNYLARKKDRLGHFRRGGTIIIRESDIQSFGK